MRTPLVWVLLAACQQNTPPVAAVDNAPPAVAPAVPHTPFVIANKVVGEDGAIVRAIDGAHDYDFAIPDGPHRFEVGGFLVDTATGKIAQVHPPAVFETGGYSSEYKLVRYEPDGRKRWSVAITGVRTVRPPDVAVGGGKTVVTIDSSIRAFDDATGKVAWQTDGGGDRLHIAGETLYAVHCNEPTNDHWLIGSNVATGVEKFRVALALGCDPQVTIQNDRIIVVEEHRPAMSLVLDLAGHQLAKLDEVVGGDHREPWGASFAAGDKLVLVTDKHVLALDRAGKVVWQRAPLRSTFVAGDQIVALPGGDLVIANYGQIDDSGVDVVRLRADGSTVWHSCAVPLGVAHSEYGHLAYVEVRGDALYVVSQGSYGAFLEKLSAKTGDRELRCVLSEKTCQHPPPRHACQ